MNLRPPTATRSFLGYFVTGAIGVAIVVLAGCQTARRSPATPPPRVQPLDASVGRVVSINPRLGFVVLDFTLSRPPQPGDRLEVSRAGTVVGQLKVGFHQRGTTLVADIIIGAPEVGDEVRPVEKTAGGTPEAMPN